MLVWIAEFLTKYNSDFHVISYITVRAILALLTALWLSLWIGPKVIRRLQLLKFGQVVRNDGPESHFAKRYANDGRCHDSFRHRCEHIIMGGFNQSICLV